MTAEPVRDPHTPIGPPGTPGPEAPADTLLEVSRLAFAYPGGPPLFSGLSFSLAAGLTRLEAEVGKTTLVRLLAGALRPADGEFRLVGRPWVPGDTPARACWIDPRDPAWDGLRPEAVAAVVRQRFPGFDDAAWARHAEGFGLGEHLGKTMHMLSTGSRRKVALAATLASRAPLNLLDEPTAGLDRPALDWLVQALAEQAAPIDLHPGQPEHPGPAGRAWLLAAAWGLEDRLPWAAVLDF